MHTNNPFEEIFEKLNRIENTLKVINDETIAYHKSNSKLFLSPKEFGHLTGIPYSSVVYYCQVGKLKARQEEAKSNWQILVSEVERYKKEANENI